jgi:choline dehydrogenase-like flavoprotein
VATSADGGERVRDVIVVGAGGGGAVVAKELAARGLDVLVLEAGPRFADPEREWTHFSQRASNPATGYFRWGPADPFQPPYARELHPSTIVVQQAAGVGGTTLHYSANSPRAMPGAFQGYRGRDHGAYDRRHLFPFAYRELIPYYEWVEHTLPVRTAPMGTKEEVFFRGARRAGLRVNRFKDVTRASFRPQENAILQPAGTAGRSNDPARATFPRARGCTFCGHCFEGCYSPLAAPRNLKAKRSTDNSYIPMALTADLWQRGGRAAELVAGVFVDRVEVSRRGDSAVATGVSWRDPRSGEHVVERARAVVLAAGAIESPRLWLNSRLPDPNGWVGRGMTNHFEELVVGLMPFDTGYSKGPQSAARADFPGRGSLQCTALAPSGTAALLAAGTPARRGRIERGRSSGRLVGRELTRFLADIDRLLGVVVLTDDDVNSHNRVSLSRRLPPDAHGRVPRIDVPARGRTARSIRNRRFLIREATRILERAGAVAVHVVDGPPVLGHIHSTLRMGRHRGESVLDRHGEARWVKRLFVADNSALANALGGPNPTLTTQAVATRVAERVFQRYFDGTPWVKRESPTSSIDHRVTRAVRQRHL